MDKGLLTILRPRGYSYLWSVSCSKSGENSSQDAEVTPRDEITDCRRQSIRLKVFQKILLLLSGAGRSSLADCTRWKLLTAAVFAVLAARLSPSRTCLRGQSKYHCVCSNYILLVMDVPLASGCVWSIYLMKKLQNYRVFNKAEM